VTVVYGQLRSAALAGRACFTSRRCRAAAAIAVLALASCDSPLQRYANDQSKITNVQIEIEQKQVEILLSHDRRIAALEAATKTPRKDQQ
jgi:hypothetical protein